MRISTETTEVLFVDTWGWLALADDREPGHARATAEFRNHLAPGRSVTTDYVLDETFTRLFQRLSYDRAKRFAQRTLDAVSSGFLRLERIDSERFGAAWRLRLRYHDHPGISFTDFTSFVVMRELKIRDVLTADAHFAKVNLGFRRLPGGVN